MGKTLADLAPPPGAKKKRKRLGRGPGSGQGTTAGKGQKGQKSRSGTQQRPWFEGGQMPLQRRLPKRGFKNPFRVEYAPCNVGRLGELFSAGEAVDPDLLKDRGLIPRRARLIKILGQGELPHALTIRAHAFSRVSLEKIRAAGGTSEIIHAARRQPRRGQTGQGGER